MGILVTGGGGFIGDAVTRALAQRGDTVIAFDTRFGRGGSTERLIQVEGDITDLAALMRAMQVHKPDAIVHCAAIVGALSSIGSPANVVRVNVEGSLNVFEAMRLAGVERCIHISSEEVYGSFRDDTIDESHPLDPVLPYGICKAAVEQLGRTYRDLHGLEIINLRTSWVYGLGLPRNRVPKILLEAALADQPLHISSGADTLIDHTYIDDVVAAVLRALGIRKHRFDAYNVASGQAVSVSELIAIVQELVPGARLSVGPGPYRHGDRIDMVKKGALDVSRAAAELGWRPRFDVRSGLAAYAAAIRTQSNTQ